MTVSENQIQGMGSRTIAGSLWLLAARFAQQFFSLVQIVVLARLLDPHDFGLIGIANLTTLAIGVFVYAGFDSALIQKTELDEADLHTAWWLTLLRYLAIAVILLILAKPISLLYKTPEAVTILSAFALIQPLLGLASISPVLFRKQMEFRQILWIDGISALTGMLFGIIAAFILRNVWAFVLAYLASAITVLFLSYALNPFRPRFIFSWESFRTFTQYGKWILGASIFSFIFSQSSSTVSGWMFGVSALGYYQMAYRFSVLPSTQLSEVIQSTLIPAYSQIQRDHERVQRAFLKTLSLTAFIFLGLSALIAFGLPPLFTILLGEKWEIAASLVPILAVTGGIQAMLRTGSPLFLGIGRPRFQFYSDMIQACTMLVFMIPMGRAFGLKGLQFAVLCGGLLAFPVWWLGVKASTFCTFKQLLKVMFPYLFGVGIIAIIFGIESLIHLSLSDPIFSVSMHLLTILLACASYIGWIFISQKFNSGYFPLFDFGLIMKKWFSQVPNLKLNSQ